VTATPSGRLSAGDAAPDFTLDSDTGEQVSLAGLRGRKVIVYFYPNAMTPGCTTQACDFSDSLASLQAAGFRALGLGKVVGTPTMGAVIGTGSYSLIDGSTVRTPGTGVYLFDKQLTNMENYGVRPDILVENAPEDTLAGRDRQLETAVQELLKELQGGGRRLAAGEEK